MGDLYLELTIVNIHNYEKQKELQFLVDTGASRAWIPKEVAELLEIQPIGTVPIELADSSVKDMQYGMCLFDFGGERVAGNVIIGPKGCEPIVGTHVLQDFRVIIDMDHHRISRGRAMRAKQCNLLSLRRFQTFMR